MMQSRAISRNSSALTVKYRVSRVRVHFISMMFLLLKASLSDFVKACFGKYINRRLGGRVLELRR